VSTTKKKDNVRRAGIGVLLLGGILLFIGIFGVISMPFNWINSGLLYGCYKTTLIIATVVTAIAPEGQKTLLPSRYRLSRRLLVVIIGCLK
jgi:hypothetical protein